MAVTSKWRLFYSKLIDEVRNTRLKEFQNTKTKANAWIAVGSEMGSVGTYSSSTQNNNVELQFLILSHLRSGLRFMVRVWVRCGFRVM